MSSLSPDQQELLRARRGLGDILHVKLQLHLDFSKESSQCMGAEACLGGACRSGIGPSSELPTKLSDHLKSQGSNLAPVVQQRSACTHYTDNAQPMRFESSAQLSF